MFCTTHSRAFRFPGFACSFSLFFCLRLTTVFLNMFPRFLLAACVVTCFVVDLTRCASLFSSGAEGEYQSTEDQEASPIPSDFKPVSSKKNRDLSRTSPCVEGDLPCQDGRCILARWQCDGQRDCRDGSDEVDCGNKTCAATQFLCDSVRCLPLYWRCDGQMDCADGSDEKGEVCQKRCPSSHFRCADGQCIPSHWTCDGEKDCRSGEDEDDKICLSICTDDQWRCRIGNQCISQRLVCDGLADCKDRSDESRTACANGSGEP